MSGRLGPSAVSAALLVALAASARVAAADLPTSPAKGAPTEEVLACRGRANGALCKTGALDGLCKTGGPSEPELHCWPFASLAELDAAEAREKERSPVRDAAASGAGAVLILAALGLLAMSFRAAERRRWTWRLASLAAAAGALAALRFARVDPSSSPAASVYTSTFVLPGGVSHGPFPPAGEPGTRAPTGSAIGWSSRAPVRLFHAGGRERFAGVVDTREAAGYVGAFDAERQTPEWLLGPFESEAWFAWDVTAQHLVAVDQRGRAHIVDLSTGVEETRIRLTDRAEKVIAAPNGEPFVWVAFKDGRHCAINPETAVVSEVTTPPAWLSSVAPPAGSSAANARGGSTHIGSRVFKFYETDVPSKQFRLAVSDAGSGKGFWDVAIDFDLFYSRSITADGYRVYLSTYGKLLVLDATTGAEVGAIGPPPRRDAP